MKQTIISRLVVGALAALAATSSFAGQIQSSSISIAREVITTDAQLVTSPSISYRFAGDVDARNQNQTFQVQFILSSGGEWDISTITNATIQMTDGVDGKVVTQSAPAATPATTLANAFYTVGKLDVSKDKKTLFATITVTKSTTASDNSGLVKQPIISVSTSGTVANNPSVTKLFSVVGTVGECDTTVKTLPVAFKHYVGLQDPTVLATDTNATKDEHNRAGSQNETMLMTFPTNVLVKVTPSTGNAKVDVSTGSISFAGTTVAGTSYLNANLVNLGNVTLKQNAQGYDSNLVDPYLLAGRTGTTGLVGVGTAAVVNGNLEVASVDITVSAPLGFQEGGSLKLATDAACTTFVGTTGTVAITSANAAGPIKLSVPAASINATFGALAGTAPVYVCYVAAGTKIIPGSSFNIDAAVVTKAGVGATVGLNEQNNYCKGPLFPLSGSIKIDVRNYASAARGDKWQSVIRLINPSETKTVDVYGQYIQASGLYGNWGKLATLAPRAVLNMDAATVDGKLTSAPAHATAANNATSAVSTTGDAPRLRITSTNADTLRVQNYLYNPSTGNFIEASSDQGVDFAGTTDRAPANEGQYISQDAQKGLNGSN